MKERFVYNFKILSKIGEGGMGEVFRAVDIMLDRDVAIKFLRPELSSREDVVERFHSEAIALAKLNHPNIASLYSFHCLENQFFMVLELIHGEPLDKIIARLGRLTWSEATCIICQTLDGLQHAHSLGIIHRDLKPSNLMLTSGGILKIMDFGIARILGKNRLTKDGRLIGTLEYMSPEQILGRETDARTDIYSLGTICYEMITGNIPFERISDYDIIKAQIEELPKPPSQFIPELPCTLEKAILRALAKSPEKRFPCAAACKCEVIKSSKILGLVDDNLTNIKRLLENDLASDNNFNNVVSNNFFDEAALGLRQENIKYSKPTLVSHYIKSCLNKYIGFVFLFISATIAIILLVLAFYPVLLDKIKSEPSQHTDAQKVSEPENNLHSSDSLKSEPTTFDEYREIRTAGLPDHHTYEDKSQLTPPIKESDGDAEKIEIPVIDTKTEKQEPNKPPKHQKNDDQINSPVNTSPKAKKQQKQPPNHQQKGWIIRK